MNWISTQENPKPFNGTLGESDYLLCKQKDHSVPFVGWFDCAKRTWHVAHYKADSDPVEVTHWMPLPENPVQ